MLIFTCKIFVWHDLRMTKVELFEDWHWCNKTLLKTWFISFIIFCKLILYSGVNCNDSSQIGSMVMIGVETYSCSRMCRYRSLLISWWKAYSERTEFLNPNSIGIRHVWKFLRKAHIPMLLRLESHGRAIGRHLYLNNYLKSHFHFDLHSLYGKDAFITTPYPPTEGKIMG